MKKVYIPTNPALLAFGVENVTEEFARFCLCYSELPLVSVGSGFGRLERQTSDLVKAMGKGKEFILIDPAPDSFQPLVEQNTKEESDEARLHFGLLPNYPLLDNLFIEKPWLFVGNLSLLLLCWCDYGENPYDLGALLLLRPRAIFIVTHRTGAANSNQLHEYFKRGEGSKRYRLRRMIEVKCLKGESEEAKYCRENHSPYLIQWLVDSHVTPHEPATVRKISCLSTEHKNAPEIEILKSFMSFMKIFESQ